MFRFLSEKKIIISTMSMITRSSTRAATAVDNNASDNVTNENEPFDISNFLDEVDEAEENVERSADQRKALQSMDITEEYYRRGMRTINSFVKGLEKVGKFKVQLIYYVEIDKKTHLIPFSVDENGFKKWEKMLQLVANPHRNIPRAPKEVPRAFVVCSGHPVTQEKILLANKMIVDWQIDLKKVKITKENGLPVYATTTQNTELRVFFAFMKRMHNWQFVKKNFRGFEGSVAGVNKELYGQRAVQHVSMNGLIFLFFRLTYFTDILTVFKIGRRRLWPKESQLFR